MPIIALVLNEIYAFELSDGVLGFGTGIAFLAVGFVFRKPLNAMQQAHQHQELSARKHIIKLIAMAFFVGLPILLLAYDTGVILGPFGIGDGHRYMGFPLAFLGVMTPFFAFFPTPFAMFNTGVDERDQTNVLQARDVGQRVFISVGMLAMCCDFYGFTTWPAAFWVGVVLGTGVLGKQVATTWIELRS